MSNYTTFTIFSQLLTQLPVLLVYFGGLIACAVLWRRAAYAAMLAMIGLGVMLLVTVVGSLLTSYLIQSRMNGGTMGTAQLGQIMTVVTLARAILHGIGMALVVSAVFVGRGREPAGFEVQMGS